MIYTLIIILILIFLVSGTYLTGHQIRDYQVSPPDQEIDFLGKQVKLSELADIYQPDLYHNSSFETPPLLWIWYEPILQDDYLDIIYSYAWENEINPIKVLHIYYSQFRAVFYGYPVYDIEYIQVRISRENGNVVYARFETSSSNDYDKPFQEHLVNKVTINSYQDFVEKKYNQDGDLLSEESTTGKVVINNRIQIASQTWNHMQRIKIDETYDQRIDASLQFLGEEEYKKYRFVRKSQSDYQTEENFISNSISAVTKFIFLTLPAAILLFIFSAAKKQNNKSKG